MKSLSSLQDESVIEWSFSSQDCIDKTRLRGAFFLVSAWVTAFRFKFISRFVPLGDRNAVFSVFVCFFGIFIRHL